MSDPVGFEFGKKLPGAFVIEMFDAAAAVGCYDLKFLGMNLEKPRHERTSVAFEVAQHAHFIGEPFFSLWSSKRLVHPAVVADADLCPQSILDVVHA